MLETSIKQFGQPSFVSDDQVPKLDPKTPGAFTILGVQNGNDLLNDSILQYTTIGDEFSKIVWESSPDSDHYKVLIYEADGLTVKCPEQISSTNSFNFSTCPLALGAYYKVQVVAVSAEQIEVKAANGPFTFLVNRMPSCLSDVSTVQMNSSINTITVVANDSDLDGHSINLVSVSVPSHGIALISGNLVIYTPSSGYFGNDSFTYIVNDGYGGVATGSVSITVQNSGGLAISSSTIAIAHGRTWQFSASGGTQPYSFSVAGGGTIDSLTGLYSSTRKGGYTATVKVTDSTLSEATATVQVKAIPSFSYCNPTAYELRQSLYGVMFDPGGSGSDYLNDQYCDYEIFWDKTIPIKMDAFPNLSTNDEIYVQDFSDPQNILSSTGTTLDSKVLFGGHFYSYFYSDSAGTAPGGEIVWYPNSTVPMTLLAQETSVFAGGSVAIDVINGVGPFTFQIISGSGNLAPTAWNDQIQFVSSAGGTTVVKVTDATNTDAQISISVIPLGTAAATLNNCPASPSPLKQVMVNATGVDVTSVKYKVVPQSGDCALDAGYSDEQSALLPIFAFLDWGSSQKLCVLSKNLNYGWLPKSAASSCSWTKDTQSYPKIEFAKSIQIITESSATLTATITSTVPVQRDTTVTYIVKGSATPSVDHNLVSGSVLLPAGQSQVDINFSIFSNALVSAEKSILLELTDHDNRDATFGGRIEHQVIIKDDETTPSSLPTKISVGSKNTCVVMSDGAMKCWGENRYGQLATGSTFTTSDTPVTIFSSGAIDVRISTFYNTFICGTKTGGSLWCWGSNSDGQLGDNTYTTRLSPIQVFASGVVDFDLGLARACAVLSTGALYCWGSNSYGALGDGTSDERKTPTLIIPNNVLKVSMGNGHTCALKTGGEVWCWGVNYSGQVGDGSTNQSLIPIQVVGSGALDLVVGQNDTCAIFTGGELKCWGETMSQAVVPTVVFASGVASVVGGYSSICALMTNSTIQCKGWNVARIWRSDDQYEGYWLGGSFATSMVQVNESGFSKIAFRDRHMCGIKIDGSLLCWGVNIFGQLGKPSSIAWAPRKIDPNGYQKIAGNKLGTMCGLTSGGALDCWGSGNSGSQFSTFVPNKTTSSLNVPLRMYTSGIQDIIMGGGSSCVIKAGGALDCWGYMLGQSHVYPKTLFNSGVVKASISSDNNCAVFNTGELKCWSGYYRGDGLENTNGSHDIISIFPSGVKDVSTKNGLSCAVFTNGSVKCWGSSVYYRLGDGFNVSRASPVEIIPSGVDMVSVGSSAACVLYSTTGQLKCWGANQFGAVGDGTVSHKSIPTNIFTSGVKQVMSADSEILLSHTCIIQSNDTVQCFGTSRNGQIGNGNWTDYVLSPYTVTGVSNATYITTFGDRSCAIVTGGDIYCWGENELNTFGYASPPTWFNYILGL